MKRTKLLSSTLLVILLAACNRQESLFDSSVRHQSNVEIGKSQLRKENAKSDDSLSTVESEYLPVDSHIVRLQQSPSLYINTIHTSQKEMLLDSIIERYRTSKAPSYLKIVAKLSDVSDGDFSELLGNKLYTLFIQDSYGVGNFVFRNRKDCSRLTFLLCSEVVLSDKLSEFSKTLSNSKLPLAAKQYFLRKVQSIIDAEK